MAAASPAQEPGVLPHHPGAVSGRKKIVDNLPGKIIF